MRNRQEAEKEVARLGQVRMALHSEEAVEIAMRGWPAWRIAQHYRLSPELIHELGGQKPRSIQEEPMDIVERLRSIANDVGHGMPPPTVSHCQSLREAADEIERLRADNEILRTLLDREVLGDPNERPGS